MEKKQNKFGAFIKKNIYVILMIVCLLAIAALITYTAVATANKPDDTIPSGNIVDADGNNVDDNKPDDNKPDDNKPDDNQPTQTFVIDAPIANAEIIKDYVDTELVYNATMKHWSTHQGIDYKADEGAAVRSVYGGEVVEITTTVMRGTQVTVKHSDGFSSTYSLLGDNVTVKVGDKVAKGDVLGYVAQTGYFESADGPHIHFELRKDNQLVDPHYYFGDNQDK